MYRSYKITGLKIEYKPNFIDGGNGPGINMEAI
jgi:hypothetical protein